MTYLETLEAVEATSKRTEKEALLQEAVNDEKLKTLLVYALDPYRTYGLAKLPKKAKQYPAIPVRDLEGFFKLLDKLDKRYLTGNAAKEAVAQALDAMDELTAKWAGRVLLKKLRCGVSGETVEKVWPGLVPRFDVALAHAIEFNDAERFQDLRPVTPLQYPLWADAKLDGLRCVAMKYDDGSVELRSRNGQLYEDFPTCAEALVRAPCSNVVLDCEILGTDWNETQSVAFSKKNKKDDSNMRLNVFDAVSLDAWTRGKSTVPYSDRLAWVQKLVKAVGSPKIITVPGRTVNSEQEMLAFFLECLEAGYEGIMLKKLDAVYHFGRSKAVMKAKPVSTHEGKIMGFFEGKEGGKRAGGLGGFFVKLPNGAVTRVGGGFKDAQLAEYWARGEDAMKGLIVECKAQFLTDDGKMRFPRLVRFRDPADVAPEVNAIEV